MNDTLIRAVQGIWKTSAPEHLGPDPDCVPILRFLGMNLERVDEERSKELDMPIGSILLSQMEYILDVLLKFEPSLQLKTRTTPGNQESSSPSSSMSHDQAVAEHLESLNALIADDVIDADKAAKASPKLHYNSDQVVINLPAIVGCLNWLRSRPDIAWATSRAASLITYSSQAYLSILAAHIELCTALCSDTSIIQAKAMGSRRCLLCTDRGEESARNCCLSWYHL